MLCMELTLIGHFEGDRGEEVDSANFGSMKISHLIFANDLIIFGEAISSSLVKPLTIGKFG